MHGSVCQCPTIRREARSRKVDKPALKCIARIRLIFTLLQIFQQLTLLKFNHFTRSHYFILYREQKYQSNSTVLWGKWGRLSDPNIQGHNIKWKSVLRHLPKFRSGHFICPLIIGEPMVTKFKFWALQKPPVTRKIFFGVFFKKHIFGFLYHVQTFLVHF